MKENPRPLTKPIRSKEGYLIGKIFIEVKEAEEKLIKGKEEKK